MRSLTGIHEVARRQAGLVDHEQCDDLGIGSNRRTSLVRRGIWKRVTRGVYDTGEADPDLHPYDLDRLRTAWRAMLGAGREAVAVGQTALALQGVQGLPARIVPEVTLPGRPHNRGPAGVVVRRYRLPREYGVVGLGRLAVPVWQALAQAVPQLARGAAVSVMDSALSQGRVAAWQIEKIEHMIRGRRGAARVWEWWPLVDGRAASPSETLARLDCIDHGLPPDDLQVTVRDAEGRFLGRGDLGWRRRDGSWVLVEIDGHDVHSQPEALYRDRARQNALITRGGATVLRFTAADARRPGTIAATVRSVLAAER